MDKKNFKFNANEDPWTLIDAYFSKKDLEQLVRHQIESYNDFINRQIPNTIEMFNPVQIVSEHDYNRKFNKYELEILITFQNFSIYRPQIHENNGATKLMFPQEARLRNFTYASNMTIDMNIKYIIRKGEELENIQTFNKILPKIHLGKLPIMLKSGICILSHYKHVPNDITGECKLDPGGYFIINGSEKTCLGQERAAENKIYCFDITKNNTKWSHIAEIKSVPSYKCISPKQISIMVSQKNNGYGNGLYIQIPRIKQPIPLIILFRALGIISDKQICKKIVLDINDKSNQIFLNNLRASIIDANDYQTRESAIKYIATNVIYTPLNMDKETGNNKKLEFAKDVLRNDLFPHCHNETEQIYFLGYMTLTLLKCYNNLIAVDDRDSYLNKRIDLTGILLNNLFRNYFNKLVKDMQKQTIREINNGSWKSTGDYSNIINFTNIYKIVKSTTIENGFKRALATGDFGIKQINSNKVGVAQVLSRLTHISSISHLRRCNTPIDKSGKLIPPRKLHNSSWGFLCPAECFDPETPILMWNGIIKRAGDIQINDILIDDNGNPTKIRSICSGQKNMYDIIPDKSNFIKHRVTDNHILTLHIRQHKKISCINRINRSERFIVKFLDRKKLKIEEKSFLTLDIAKEFIAKFTDDDTIDITIENYLKLNKNTQKHLVLLKTNGINWGKKEVSLDPYLLGMWLGDGLSVGTGFALNYKTDFEILEYWEKWAENNAAIITKDKRYKYSIVSQKNKAAREAGLCNRVEQAPLKKYLKQYNLINNKHIPNDYLTNDRETRLKVLAGLIDTDGSVRAKGAEIRICQGPKNYRIIEDTHILAISLGFSCGIKERQSQWTDKNSGIKKFSSYKELTITGNGIYEIPTLLPRKKLNEITNNTQIVRNKEFKCSLFKLKEVGMGKYVGWQLEDKRGRFLLSDGIVVHNTPEGASVGVVKNISYLSSITINSNTKPLLGYINDKIILLNNTNNLNNKIKVFVNGTWVGTTEEPNELYESLKNKKYKGIINIYTSIVFDYKNKEIRVCNDAGRLIRPLLKVKNNKLLLTREIMDDLRNGKLEWNDLVCGYKLDESVIEYIDPMEQNYSMIAINSDKLTDESSKFIYKYTHCEIHPSTIFGILASCIPFPENNQAPRLCYQCLDLNEVVWMSDRTKKRMGEIKIGDNVLTFNPETLDVSETKVINHFIRENNNQVYKIKTISGREIIATEDHKFMTNSGWKSVKELINNNEIKIGITMTDYTINSFESVSDLNYKLIINEDKFLQKMRCLDIDETSNRKINKIFKYVNYLQNVGLLPLYNNNKILPILARIIGYLYADGSINIYLKKRDEKYIYKEFQCAFDFGTMNDAIQFQNDIDKCGFQKVKIMEGKRTFAANNEERKQTHHTFTCIYNGCLPAFLISLGISYGKKTETLRNPIPDWIINNKEYGRQFIKGFQGGDGCKIRSNYRNFVIGETSQQINPNYIKSLKEFMTQCLTILKSFNVEVSADIKSEIISETRTKLSYCISSKMANLIKYFEEIGYAYAETKNNSSFKVVEYLKMKREYLMENNLSKLESNHNFISIHNFMDTIVVKNNFIFMPIKSIIKESNRLVGDLEVESENHSFIAGNNFASSNCAMGKQAMGTYVTNYHNRMDKTAYVLTYGMRPLVDTRLMDIIKLNKIPSGAQVIVAIATYTGYNQEDSLLFNKASIERGLFQATIFHTEKDEDKKIHGDEEIRCKPDKTKTKSMKYGNYEKVNENGVIPENELVCDRDIIISKILPIKEARNNPTKVIKYEDQSRIYRTKEETYIDKNYIHKNGEGYNFAKVRLRCLRQPVIGDKFSSRHGQKGTIGNIIPEEDIPFTAEGIKPDIIINPHAIPSRMTIGQLKETLLGKILLELGLYGDGTSFGDLHIDNICKELQKIGYESKCNEVMYDGLTGEQIEADIFIGPVFYQRLRHMVNDKQHSRSIGPMVNLTRQPAEGRSRDGGLRFGEMEKDATVAHGASRFTKGRIYDASDAFGVSVCKKCGLIALYNNENKIHICKTCENRTDFNYVKLPYSAKLLFQELISMNIAPRIITE